jgi:hypothetical protein
MDQGPKMGISESSFVLSGPPFLRDCERIILSASPLMLWVHWESVGLDEGFRGIKK